MEFRQTLDGQYCFAKKDNTLIVIRLTLDNPFLWVMHKEATEKKLWERYNSGFEKAEPCMEEDYIDAKRIYIEIVDSFLFR